MYIITTTCNIFKSFNMNFYKNLSTAGQFIKSILHRMDKNGMSSPSIFSFMCMFCRSLFYPFVLFFLAIVLSVLFRFTNSDYLPLVYSTSFWYYLTDRYIKFQVNTNLYPPDETESILTISVNADHISQVSGNDCVIL